jgi:lambda repressor-like predicted transcriptional regulator
MKKYVKAIGITTALAVMIPLSAYAATTAADSSGAAASSSVSAIEKGGMDGHWRHGKHGKHGFVSQEVLDLLKLDEAGFKEKLQAGKTLAQIAKEQGVSREALKKTMTEAFNKRVEEHKKNFTANLDKMIDSQPHLFDGRGGGFHVIKDFTAISKVLGLTMDEIKNGLRNGKSLADLAAEQKVDVQKLIDAQKAAITSAINQAVKDGKLTQAQANEKLDVAGDLAEKIVNGKDFGHKGRHGGH